MVLKTGPDRSVQLGTGVLFGSVLQKNWKFRKSSQKPETDGSTVKTANRHGWTGYGPVLGFPKLTVLKPKTTKSQSKSKPVLTLEETRSTLERMKSTLERRKQRWRTSWQCPLKPLFDVTMEVAYKWRSSWREKLDLGSMCVWGRETVKV